MRNGIRAPGAASRTAYSSPRSVFRHCWRGRSPATPLLIMGGALHLPRRCFSSCFPPPSGCSFLFETGPQDAGFPPYKEPDEDSVSNRAEALNEEEIKGWRAWVVLLRDWGFVANCLAAFTTYIGR